MMVAVGTVHVPVGDLFGGGRAHVDHGAVEAQALARERMVAVDHDLAFRDIGHSEDARTTLIAFALGLLELHPDLHAVGEAVFALDAHKIRVVLAESVIRLERDRAAIAGLLLLERRFDLRKYAVMAAVDVNDRLL